jgi:preprotein translocase subunit SecG
LTARIVIVLVALIALTIAVLLNRRGSIIKKATSLNWR